MKKTRHTHTHIQPLPMCHYVFEHFQTYLNRNAEAHNKTPKFHLNSIEFVYFGQRWRQTAHTQSKSHEIAYRMEMHLPI